MNEQNLPPDELASAFLDGELDETAAGTVRDDPELAARADELRRAADAVGAPVTPPAGAEDAAVEAALADFDARSITPLEPASRRSRRLTLITGVAAAVAVGFIIAAAAGLFTERQDANDEDATAAAAPAPPAEPAPAPEIHAAPADESALAPPAAPEPPPPPSAEPAAELDRVEALATEALEAAHAAEAAALLAQATAAGNEAAVAAAEAALAEAQAAAEAARTEAVAAQAEAAEAREAAAAAETEAAAAQAEAAAAQAEAAAAAPGEAASATRSPDAQPEAAPPEDMAGDMAADDMADDMAPAMPPDDCDAAVGDGTVELRITVGDTPVLVIRTVDDRLVALDGTSCDAIRAEPDDTVYPLPSESCVAAVGDGRVALRITVGDTPVLVVRTVDGRLVGLGGDTCDELPPVEPG